MPPKASTSAARGPADHGKGVPRQAASSKPTEAGSTSTGKATNSKLSKAEKTLFDRCSRAGPKALSGDEVERALPELDEQARVDVVNSLIGRGMLEIRSDGGELRYRVIDKSRQKLSSGMLPDEKLVFDHIANAGNTGIWTKTLKARTNIHQTNINKYLKSLEGKNLVKSVKSVKHPTRKIYMLEELQPSIELSGGPWYTDNELDTEFIGYLLRGIRKCLQERSFPSTETRGAPMYPTNHTPYLGTTVDQVLEYLAHLDLIQAGTELSTEHISSLLDVLIYDGEVERVMVAAAKDETMGGASGGQGSDSEDEARSTSRGKRRKGASPVTANKKRRIREASVDSDNIDGDEDGGGDEAQAAGLADGGPSDSDEVEGLAQSKTGPSSHRPRRAKPRPPTGQIFMYRSIRPGPDDSAAARITGIYDMPCGRCPQFTFCSEKGGPWQSRVKGDPPLARIGLAGIGAGFGAVGGLGSQGGVAPVNPVDCIYFNDWLDF